MAKKTDFKARLCVRGFQENIVPRSDSPTAAKNMLKLSLAIAANEGWRLENLDVTSAFLQGTDLEREVYVMPPKEIQLEGQLWKLKKGAYGLYDAARMWFLAVVQSLEELQMESIVGDNAVFYYREGGRTQGVINVHVDDFITMGTESFYNNVVNKLKTKFNFSKIERGEDGFRFTGVDIKTTSNGIIMNQDVYASCIQELEIPKGDNNDLLNKEQFKQFRGLTGKLIWLSEQT